MRSPPCTGRRVWTVPSLAARPGRQGRNPGWRATSGKGRGLTWDASRVEQELVGIRKLGPVVAIDGPAGAGKSTLARELARALGLPYLNTGLMYRAVAAGALADGVPPGDGERLAAVARRLRFSIAEGPGAELSIDQKPPGPELVGEAVEGVV